MKKLILASSSPNRKALLERLGQPFTCISPDIDESPRLNEFPADLAIRLSIEKAQKIAEHHPQDWVIGSDQVCASGSHIINKPHTHDNAMAQWTHLSGNTATFYTGVAVAHMGQIASFMVPTEVLFKKMAPAQIDRYLKKDKPYECCAGFKIESLGIALTQWVKSEDPTALIGLPLIKTVELLAMSGFSLFE